MRTTFILNRALPPRRVVKTRLRLNGKDTTVKEMIALLEKHGYVITEREFFANAPATSYRGIPIGSAFWGQSVWAKKKKDTHKLFDYLNDDGYYDHRCSLDVEKREDASVAKEEHIGGEDEKQN